MMKTRPISWLKAARNDDDFELVRGSGNVFRDVGHPNAELEQLRSILAARIVEMLDGQNMTVRKAHEVTGFAAADFSRVRRANLGRFTVDRLMTMLARLGDDVEVTVTARAGDGAHPLTEPRSGCDLRNAGRR